MTSDQNLLALNAYQEANLEIDDGVAAVCRVVMNRVALHYQSDGTIQGAILHPLAFSWTQFEMVEGHYTQVAHTTEQVEARVASLLASSQAYATHWARCLAISGRVAAKTYRGDLYDRLTDQVVLYTNLALARPAWATPDKLVATIGHHSFYHN
jgi:spore germination cell wall hydrolase CwlJ-like protein